MSPHALRHMLDDGPHLRALRRARRAQDRYDRRAARHVIDVHRCEAALVVMRVPERKLLTAMRRTERVVDVENLLLARLHCRAGLVDESGGEPRRLRLARRILQTTDRRLRGQRLRRCPDSDRPRASSADHAAAGRGRWHPCGRTRSQRRAPSPSRTFRDRCGSDRVGPASHRQSRRHTPSLRSACRSSSRPPSEDWLPPSKSTVSFLRWTDGRSKGSSVSYVMAAVALG